MKAKLGVKKTLFFFDTAAAVVAPSLLSAQVKSGATVVATLTFVPVPSIPNLYRSSDLTLTKAGQYEVVFRYNAVPIESAYLGADVNPVTDYSVGASVNLKLPKGALGTQETVTAKVVTSLGVVGNSIAAPYVSGSVAYQAPYSFNAAGDYCVIWYRVINNVVTPIKADTVFTVIPSGRELIKFVAGNGLDQNVSAPYINAKLVITDMDGNWVAQTTTTSNRMASLELPPGSYRATLVKSPYVYTNNNFNFLVDTSPIKQVIQLNTPAISVTVTPEQTPAPVCRLYADLYRMNGTPLMQAVVRVALMHRPQLFSGSPVFDTDLAFKTDDHGHVEFDLVQGIQVEVSIAPLSIRRIITVPSGQNALDPVNLMTLMSGAQDLFDIVAPQLPAASKRSL